MGGMMTAEELMNAPEIQAAAKWWADALNARKPDDAGDGLVNFGLSLSRPEYDDLPSETVELFQRTLIRKLAALCASTEHRPDEWRYCTLGVDYGPDGKLWEVAQEVGIDIARRFPVKTVMWIEEGSVKVRVGYGADIVQPFPVKLQ